MSWRPIVSTSSTVRSPITSRITLSERSRNVFLRLACAEQIHFWISNPILHHPRHKRGVQIARDHRLSFLWLDIALINIRRAWRGKPKLELQQTLRRHDVNFIDVRNRIGQTRVHVVVIRAEPRLHTKRVCRNRREPEQQRE